MILKKRTYRFFCYRNSILILMLLYIGFSGVSCICSHTSKETISRGNEINSKEIDSLLNRIKNDTIALQNYLTIAKTNNDSYSQIMIHNYLAKYYLSVYDFDHAIQNHHISLALAESMNDTVFQIKALNNLGADYKQVCSVPQAADYYYSALSRMDQFNESSKEIESERARSLSSLGNIYLNMDQPLEAMSYMQQAYDIEKNNGNNLGQAKNLANIGSAYESMQKYDSARYYYDKSMQYNILANSRVGMAICFLRIGNLDLLEKDNESALINLDTAYKTLRETSDKVNWANTCFALGEINIILNNYAEAEKYLNEGLTIVKNAKLLYFLEKGYNLIATMHKKQGRLALAADEFVLSNLYAEDLKNEMRGNQLLEGRMNFEREQNKKNLETITQEFARTDKRKTNFINLILLIIAALILYIVIIFHFNQQRKLKNRATLKFEKLKADFYMNISHEFKTPVNIILGLTDQLKRNFENGNATKNAIDLDVISRQSENILFLLDEILSMSKLHEQDKPAKRVKGDIIQYMRYMYECFEHIARSKNIIYTFNSNVEKLIMIYPPDYMRVIINNLLSDSIKHCSENDRIELSVIEDSANKTCIIRINNTGEGIAQENLPYIFNGAHRQRSSDLMKNNSSDINLAFTKQLITKINGKIEVRSIPNKKTEFIITLPVTVYDELSEHATPDKIVLPHVDANSDTENEIELPNGSGRFDNTILIVEDNQDMIYYIATVLQEKFNILTAKNGEDGLKTAVNSTPDLILSDVVMPGFDGFHLCKELKKKEMTNHIPVVMLTAKTLTEERVRGFKCGADAFLTKPFVEEELLAVIDQLLTNRKQIREKFAQLVINNNSENNEGIKNDVNYEFLRRVTDIIYRDIANSDSLISTLASEICLSPSQLNRKMKAISGLTTTNYVLIVRLNKAKKYLIKSQKPIGEIAMECGFNDFAYFSRSFKKEFGMTPTAFQRIPHTDK